jgi:tetratricopeptide (TPR) repeat protein
VRRDPALVEARVLLAQALARDGKKDEAIAEQAEIQRVNAENANFGRTLVLLDAATAQLARGRRAAAIARLREAIALSPHSPEALYRLGLALLPTTPRAKVSSSSPSSSRSVQPLAMSATKPTREAREAESLFAQVVALDPDHAHAQFELGRLLAARGDAAAAIQALQRAAAKAPSLLDARRELARVATASGAWPVAAAALKGIIAWELASGSPGAPGARNDARRRETRRALATVLDRLGATADAAAERALAGVPTSTDAR